MKRLQDLWKNSEPLAHTLQHSERLLQFLLCVRSGHDSTHPCFALRDGRKCDAGSEHTFFEQFTRKIHSQASVANDDGCDRGFARGSCLPPNVKAEQPKFFFPESSVLPE